MPPINFNPALLGIGIIIVVYLIYAATQARRRRRLQHQVLAASAETAGTAVFKMRHALAARFSAGRLPAWEGSGLIRFTKVGLTYEGVEASGSAVRLEVPADETAAVVGDPSSPDEGMAWLEIRTVQGDKYYFVPDAGSGMNTRAVVDAVNAHLLERRMGDGPTA